MRRRAAVLALVPTLAACLAGCGSTAPTPADIAQNYMNDLASGDYATACALLGRHAEETLVRRFGARVPCHAVMAHCLPNEATVLKRDQTQLLFANVLPTISGRTAYVTVSGTAVARRVKEVTLTNTRQGWQLTSYGRGLRNCRAGRAPHKSARS